MEPQQLQDTERQLREHWTIVRHQILDIFPQVSKADLDAAESVTDLTQRIADKTGYSDRYVETKIRDLVGVTSQSTPNQQGQQSFGQVAQNQQEQNRQNQGNSQQNQPQYASAGSRGGSFGG